MPTPKNPKGAGRKPTPNPNKILQSFYCDPAIAKKLEAHTDMGFKTKAEMINFALKIFIETYKSPDHENPST